MNTSVRHIIAISMLLTFGIRHSAASAAPPPSRPLLTQELTLEEWATPMETEGMLTVPTEEAFKLLKVFQVDYPLCLLDLEKLEKDSTDDIVALEALAAIDAGRIQRLEADLAASRPRWYDSPLLWVSVGVVAGVALTYSVVKLVEAR